MWGKGKGCQTGFGQWWVLRGLGDLPPWPFTSSRPTHTTFSLKGPWQTKPTLGCWTVLGCNWAFIALDLQCDLMYWPFFVEMWENVYLLACKISCPIKKVIKGLDINWNEHVIYTTHLKVLWSFKDIFYRFLCFSRSESWCWSFRQMSMKKLCVTHFNTKDSLLVTYIKHACQMAIIDLIFLFIHNARLSAQLQTDKSTSDKYVFWHYSLQL